ncbi:MAG: hypothetical protein Q7N50_10115 [Armatimonadota bacterium]|nr:hypothetical protein [Armatimonadota bacterium]
MIIGKRFGFLASVCVLISLSALAYGLPSKAPKVSTINAFEGKPANIQITGDWVVVVQKPSIGSEFIAAYNIVTGKGYVIFEGSPSGGEISAGGACAIWGTGKNSNKRFFDGLGIEDPRKGRSGLVWFDLTTWEYRSPEGAQGDLQPSVCGNLIAWTSIQQIYMADINNGSRLQISSSSSRSKQHPRIKNGLVVWTELHGINWRAYGYDIEKAEEFAITNEKDGSSSPPRTDGKTVVWSSNGIMAYDVKSGSKSKVADGFNPDIDNGIIVYVREIKDAVPKPSPRPPKRYNLFCKVLATKEESLIAADIPAQYPSICNGRIAWVKNDKIYVTQL